MQAELQEYWGERSHSYSCENIAEMNSWKQDAWRKLILSYAPKKDTLKILDVGTGPGFFTINLSLAGHEVCGIDVTKEMLSHARENAKAYGTVADFVQYDGVNVPFEDETFDLVISRNVVWNLEKPIDSMKEWKRVLKKGGRILYFDSEWYYYLYDDEAMRRHLEVQQRLIDSGKENGEHHLVSERAKRCEEIAKNLVLSKEKRPEWDVDAMNEIGMDLICLNENIGDFVWDESERMSFEDKPMFMVCAEK